MKQGLLLTLILALLAQTACTISASTATATDPCLAPTDDLKLLANTEDGYCLLYPPEFSPNPAPFILILHPVTGPGDVLGDAWVSIEMEPAEGRTAAQVADTQMAMHEGLDLPLERTEITLGGEPAVVVDGIPGPDPWRKVFVVRGERLYTLTFLPWSADPAVGMPAPPLQSLYETMVQTFRFLPPTKPLPTPTLAWGPGNVPPPLAFEYPVDGQTLDYEGDYSFKVKEIPDADAYFWSFSQNGVVVWQNLADDQGLTSGGTYLIATGSRAHSQFVPGPVEVTVRAVKGNFFADPTIITVILE
jgi:hypothetical protein